jgi:hypothetical protein
MTPTAQTVDRRPQEPVAERLAHDIRVDCERALCRLDRLSREREDVVLTHARALIGHAAALSQVIERGC